MTTYLKALEAQSIHILREVAAEFRRPVLLYSGGKDSSVMLHLAVKAFYPARPPFAILSIDTTWKFRELVSFRDASIGRLGLDLIVHVNGDGLSAGADPIHGDLAIYTRAMKTEALKQALGAHGFDAAVSGARRDEDVSRAKERIFSFRNSQHAWDPRSQRPELWRLYNTRLRSGESVRVFPLSNWTEIDVWTYVRQERIEVAPLYFAAERPVVARGDRLILVDDERLPLVAGEQPTKRWVRFRSLGCYPLTGAHPSSAQDVDQIIAEMLGLRTSERFGRTSSADTSSLESRKREGYF